jgi:hypothetical protein
MALFAFACGGALLINRLVTFHSMLGLTIAGSCLGVVYLGVAYLFLDQAERGVVRGFVTMRARKLA